MFIIGNDGVPHQNEVLHYNFMLWLASILKFEILPRKLRDMFSHRFYLPWCVSFSAKISIRHLSSDENGFKHCKSVSLK